ncbi:class I SAM-dependent methyltransferase [Methylobacterium fujisawaense]
MTSQDYKDRSAILPQLSEYLQERTKARLRDLDAMIADGRINVDWIRGKKVLDWEAGDCAFAVAIYLRGARRVVAIDSWLAEDLVPAILLNHPDFHIEKKSIIDYAQMSTHNSFDFIYANTVTEHIQEIAISFEAIVKLLRSGGIFATNHDNYYQPVGHHDHGFLFYQGSKIVSQGPKCWNAEDKCEASSDHRTDLAVRLPWTWNASHEQQRTPSNCNLCPYFKRSKPWAHLIYQDQFLETWPIGFTTHPTRGTLNKITPFMLKQFFIEAGLNIITDHRSRIENDIPLRLLAEHSADTLTATMIWISAHKK